MATPHRSVFALIGLAAALTGAAAQPDRRDPGEAALRAALTRLEEPDAFIADAYAVRGFKPMWTARQAGEVIGWLERAEDDGLTSRHAQVVALRQALSRASRSARNRATFEIVMSRALATYESDLRRPTSSNAFFITDKAVAPPSRAAVLLAAARAPSLADHLARIRVVNPVYRDFREARLRVLASPPSPARARLERVLRANMDRSRLLPADGRYILVDAASARLWLWESGRVVDTMKVISGKPEQPTPLIAGLIRYAVFDPYWNVPPDLVRDQFAPRVIREGKGVLASRRLEVLSDWSPSARPLEPTTVDWRSVADGEQSLRMRQAPGAGNMMGRVKFMFPNRMGIYLHDTPDKALFSRSTRHFSAGCVRVEDAARLSAWLGRPLPPRGGSLDQRIDMPQPVPVYVSYFTVSIEDGRIQTLSDPYARDADPAIEHGASSRSTGG